MQSQLEDGVRDIKLSKLIFKARGWILDIKIDKQWKYDDTNCSGRKQNEETGDGIMRCTNLGENKS